MGDRRVIATRIGESQRRIIEHLKRHGSGTIPEMAGALDLSVETVRAHLGSLGSERLVARSGQRSDGPGRPEIVYRLTERADALFPNQEGRILKELCLFLEERGHGSLVRTFFDGQLQRRRAAVKERLEGLDGRARAHEVARLLTAEGFMAEGDTDDEGRELLRLCHCPIAHLVEATKAPCRAELRFVREVLGKRLARVSYIPAGDSACCYVLMEED